MKKRVFLIWSILAIAVIPLLVGCGDDEKQEENQDFPYYADIGEEEQIVLELDSVPAYIYEYYRQYVFICYLEHADKYFADPDAYPELKEDIEAHRIGVSFSDIKDIVGKQGTSLGNKVYISASITNNRTKYFPPGYFMDIGWDPLYADEPKAYLKNITRRNQD